MSETPDPFCVVLAVVCLFTAALVLPDRWRTVRLRANTNRR